MKEARVRRKRSGRILRLEGWESQNRVITVLRCCGRCCQLLSWWMHSRCGCRVCCWGCCTFRGDEFEVERCRCSMGWMTIPSQSRGVAKAASSSAEKRSQSQRNERIISRLKTSSKDRRNECCIISGGKLRLVDISQKVVAWFLRHVRLYPRTDLYLIRAQRSGAQWIGTSSFNIRSIQRHSLC